ncbi:hypothetical protein SAY87_018141 [Trapa incisa]|uniref:Uncharacterized protein n=1 Tax=Trapa incisa TaxID=236973 RepID=A0AAN7L4Y5_9MYRT|nr:hypothetical protein SAY87_018141 [Trapa incisa]
MIAWFLLFFAHFLIKTPFPKNPLEVLMAIIKFPDSLLHVLFNSLETVCFIYPNRKIKRTTVARPSLLQETEWVVEPGHALVQGQPGPRDTITEASCFCKIRLVIYLTLILV